MKSLLIFCCLSLCACGENVQKVETTEKKPDPTVKPSTKEDFQLVDVIGEVSAKINGSETKKEELERQKKALPPGADTTAISSEIKALEVELQGLRLKLKNAMQDKAKIAGPPR